MKISILLPLLILNEYHRHLAATCIERMREYAGREFELVIAETGSREFEADADQYLHITQRTCINHDMIAGLALCTGELVGHTGSDILVRDGWLDALEEPFSRPDCGASTLASTELGHQRAERIEEGVYGPIMCFEAGWSYDPDYRNVFADTDLIMRIYRSGKRMFRNYRSIVTHLNQATYQVAYSAPTRAQHWAYGKTLFHRKHHDCGLIMFRDLLEGGRRL